MKTTPLHYRKYLFMYGIVTVINVLKYFEEKEDFDECYKIISAIKEQEGRLNIKLPTVINEDAIQEVVETYEKFGLTGENVIENSEYYADLVLHEILHL